MKHGSLFKFYLFVCFLLFGAASYGQNMSGQRVPLHTNKIFTSSQHPTGVFTYFKKFLDNAPAIPSFKVLVDKETNSVNIYKVDGNDSSGYLLHDVWGISVGNELYKYRNGKLYPIEMVDGGFMLSKFVAVKKRKNQAFF